VIRYHPLNGIAHPSGNPPEKALRALIDTGATHCSATADVIAELQLVFDKPWKNVTSGSEVITKDGYVADFVISPSDELSGITCAPVLKDTLALMDDKPDDAYEVILGMDALRFHTWQFSPDGSFSVSW